MSMPTPDPLDPLLDRWGNPPELSNVSMAQEVWRRIAVAENADVGPSLIHKVEAIFTRPSFAMAFMAACMLLGLFLAEARISRLQVARNHELLKSYIQLIDPLLSSPQHKPAPVRL